MTLGELSNFKCILVTGDAEQGLTVRKAEHGIDAAEIKDSICFCRVISSKDESFLKEQKAPADSGNILFYDKRELLCCDSIIGRAAEVILFDLQVFNVCNFGLLGERSFAFLQLLAEAHYCHKPDMPGYGVLENAWMNIWKQCGTESETVTETIMASLWEVTALLKKQADKEQLKRLKNDWRSKSRLMPLLVHLQENYDSKITLMDMAAMVNMSVPNFSAVFRKTMSMPPVEYLIRIRIQNAAYQIKNTDKKIIDVAQDCGFTSISNFIKAFHRYYGVSPMQYRISGNINKEI